MGIVRNAAVAGLFYPAEPDILAHEVRRHLDAVPPWRGSAPKAIIAPHAGYIYSGPIAASAYARIVPASQSISRVVLLGPSHHVAFRGVAAPSADLFQTPLGPIPVDRQALAALGGIPNVGILDAAHAREHSLEVHLPFLQAILGAFTLVPMVAGEALPAEVAAIIEALWGGDETLVVISSDLSHYLDYAAARAVDQRTCQAIERLDPVAIAPDGACGRIPIGGLLTVARRHGLAVETVDLRSSGDTAGPRDRVVGYGAWTFTPAPSGTAASDDEEEALKACGPLMFHIARSAITARLAAEDLPTAPADLPAVLQLPRACFITLKRQGQLRGCIGSALAWRPLAMDVAGNAVQAAFADPRFPPLAADELADLEISVAVLTVPQPMRFADEADLLAQLRPRIDGLIIEDGGNRALFLPAVWEMLPERADFLAHLKHKARLPPGHWSPAFAAQRFTALEIKKP